MGLGLKNDLSAKLFENINQNYLSTSSKRIVSSKHLLAASDKNFEIEAYDFEIELKLRSHVGTITLKNSSVDQYLKFS